jgi:hypothetical protein
MIRKLLAGAAVATALTWAGAASAAVVISAGNFGGTGFHSDPGLSLPSVTGHAGSITGTFSTDSPDLLDTSGSGESVYTAHDGAMDDLTLVLSDAVQAITFNLILPTGKKPSSNFNLSVNDGAFTFGPTALGHGENKYQLVASGGDLISKLAFTFTEPSFVHDIREVRIVPAGQAVPTGGVPEPATWALMLMGFGGLGAALRRRRAVALAA